MLGDFEEARGESFGLLLSQLRKVRVLVYEAPTSGEGREERGGLRARHADGRPL